MADFNLKKLNRSELIDIIYAFQQNEKDLNDKISTLEDKLKSQGNSYELTRTEGMEGETAEVYKVLEAAQQASERYVEDNRKKADEELIKATKDAELEAKKIISDARAEANEIVMTAHDEAGKIIAEARRKAERKKRNFEIALKKFCDDNPSINVERRAVNFDEDNAEEI
ncbi:MAG: hypothetical protein MJ153_02305 [Clostridia bacterium]|nr:hypothetical protein [Clostridia bacterium]